MEKLIEKILEAIRCNHPKAKIINICLEDGGDLSLNILGGGINYGFYIQPEYGAIEEFFAIEREIKWQWPIR